MSELTERLGELAAQQFEPQPPRTATAQRLAEAKDVIERLERQLADADAAVAWHASGWGFGVREGHLNGEIEARERHRARIASLKQA